MKNISTDKCRTHKTVSCDSPLLCSPVTNCWIQTLHLSIKKHTTCLFFISKENLKEIVHLFVCIYLRCHENSVKMYF